MNCNQIILHSHTLNLDQADAFRWLLGAISRPVWQRHTYLFTNTHRDTSQGLEGLQPPDSGKAIIPGKSYFFSGRSQQQKWKNVFLKRKTEFIPSSETEFPKSGIFTNNYLVGWLGESGKVILQVSIAVFRALLKDFSGKDGSALYNKKMARMPMPTQG